MNMKKMFTMQHIPEIAPALMFKKKKSSIRSISMGFLFICAVCMRFSVNMKNRLPVATFYVKIFNYQAIQSGWKLFNRIWINLAHLLHSVHMYIRCL